MTQAMRKLRAALNALGVHLQMSGDVRAIALMGKVREAFNEICAELRVAQSKRR